MGLKNRFWRHLETKEVVRVDTYRGGLLTFSIYRGDAWVRNRSLWDEVEFKVKFEPFDQQWAEVLKSKNIVKSNTVH